MSGEARGRQDGRRDGAADPGTGDGAEDLRRWRQVITVGDDLLFLREDGAIAVGYFVTGPRSHPAPAELSCAELGRCPSMCGCTPGLSRLSLSRLIRRRPAATYR